MPLLIVLFALFITTPYTAMPTLSDAISDAIITALPEDQTDPYTATQLDTAFMPLLNEKAKPPYTYCFNANVLNKILAIRRNPSYMDFNQQWRKLLRTINASQKDQKTQAVMLINYLRDLDSELSIILEPNIDRFYQLNELLGAFMPWLHQDAQEFYSLWLTRMHTEFPEPHHPAAYVNDGWQCLLNKILKAYDEDNIADQQISALKALLAFHQPSIADKNYPESSELIAELKKMVPCDNCVQTLKKSFISKRSY